MNSSPVFDGRTGVQQRSRGEGLYIAVMVAAVMVACVLRVVLLGQSSLWVDEIWSIRIAGLPWHTFSWTVRNQDPNMILYYVLLHGWMRLGDSEAIVRALSVAAGVATVPVVYAIGVRLFDKKSAVISAILLAVNAFHIQWSQEARSYSMLVLLVTLSALFFILSIQQPSRRNLILYVLVSSLALYAHIYGALVIAAQAGSLIFLKRSDIKNWRGLIGSAAAVGVAASPLLALMIDRSRHPWLPLDWLTRPTLHDIYDKFYSLAGNTEFPGSHGGKVVLTAYAIVCALPLISWTRSWRTGRSLERWGTAFLASWLVLPIGLALAASFVQPMFLSRYLIICIPALVLLAGRGIASLQPASLSATALAVLVILAAQRLPQYYEHRSEFRQWKAVTDDLVSRSQPGDAALFCIAPGRLLFDYYRDRYHQSAPGYVSVIYPAAANAAVDPRALDYLPPLDAGALGVKVRSHDRVWLVLYHDFFSETRTMGDRMRAALAADYRDVQTTTFDGVSVALYSNSNTHQVITPGAETPVHSY